MPQRNFVTGVTGFVGSHLAYRLLEDGHPVVALARGGKNASARDRVIEVLGEVAGSEDRLRPHLDRLEVLEGDISKPFLGLDENSYRRAASMTDEVWHCAASLSFTDEERDKIFEAAKALGAAGFSSSTVISEARRLVPFVERHKMFVAMHNHNNLVDPDQFATPASFETALAMSPLFFVTLDIGHFTAGNNDAVAYLREHHDRITHIHVKDRKRNKGPNVEWGTGDTPIKECLTMIRDNKWPIYAFIEREFMGTRGPVEETRRDLDYMKQALNV